MNGQGAFDFRRPLPRFDGPAYVPALDHARLSGQLRAIFALMRDGAWRTLEEVEAATGAPPASVSAQLRHLRKPRFGAHTVEKRRRGAAARGLWEYRLLVTTHGFGVDLHAVPGAPPDTVLGDARVVRRALELADAGLNAEQVAGLLGEDVHKIVALRNLRP